MPFHGVLVFEQVVAQVKEMLFEVTCVKILRRDAVVNQFPYVLSKAAAKVEKSVLGLGLFEEREDTRVAGLL